MPLMLAAADDNDAPSSAITSHCPSVYACAAHLSFDAHLFVLWQRRYAACCRHVAPDTIDARLIDIDAADDSMPLMPLTSHYRPPSSAAIFLRCLFSAYLPLSPPIAAHIR